MTHFLRIGITGGIASGKSTVSAHLHAQGYPVIDYDVLAREVIEPGSALLTQIEQEFGPESIAPDGTLNREWMAEHVFADSHQRDTLNALVHPAVYALAAQKEKAVRNEGRNVVIHDIPLLVETRETALRILGPAWSRRKNDTPYDLVLTVEADDATRIQRMVDTRGMTAQQAASRIAAQLPSEERKAAADICIDSTRPMKQMLLDVDAAVDAALKDTLDKT
ncbi:dephospho-CoA kinase [Alloscardovia macacae]|uniref:Dephospho-CoA kinase n=1 Tax=Alloscardovia macacae TaxID=1160091 RepID=A0A1Y2SV30_9BIFI|nr:dephospho-CoA kinase [Alloscardovia macacae]OTA27062.1 dephospho-CoA kinase [Alloscardovia macacae]OTA29744.1 dephospho-CoA kinase [Alloscardovia macacae]